MALPRFRKPRSALTGDQVRELVAMRDDGATWKDVGRAFRMQETAARAIYVRERRAAAAPTAPI